MRSISVIAGSTIRLALDKEQAPTKHEHAAHDMWWRLGFSLFPFTAPPKAFTRMRLGSGGQRILLASRALLQTGSNTVAGQPLPSRMALEIHSKPAIAVA